MSELVIADKSDLVAIADAIREKTETTDGMGIDEMAELIAAIKVWDGSSVATGSFVRDTDTLSYNQIFLGGMGTIEDAGLTVNHNLGKIPKIGVLLHQTRHSASVSDFSSLEAALCYESNNTYENFIVGFYKSANESTWYTGQSLITTPKTQLRSDSIGCFCNATENEIFITCGGGSVGNKLVGGDTYRWFLWG